MYTRNFQPEPAFESASPHVVSAVFELSFQYLKNYSEDLRSTPMTSEAQAKVKKEQRMELNRRGFRILSCTVYARAALPYVLMQDRPQINKNSAPHGISFCSDTAGVQTVQCSSTYSSTAVPQYSIEVQHSADNTVQHPISLRGAVEQVLHSVVQRNTPMAPTVLMFV